MKKLLFATLCFPLLASAQVITAEMQVQQIHQFAEQCKQSAKPLYNVVEQDIKDAAASGHPDIPKAQRDAAAYQEAYDTCFYGALNAMIAAEEAAAIAISMASDAATAKAKQ